jgi:uncharacterized protein (DUF697 family)
MTDHTASDDDLPLPPRPDDDLRQPPGLAELHLLGKPGAGKSLVFRALTGRGVVGTGLRATTRQAEVVDLPAENPVLRLVDQPGLIPGAPLPDLPARAAILAVARLDDPVQAPLAEALRSLRRARAGRRILIALTGAERVRDPAARARVGAAIRADLSRAAGGPLPWVELGLGAGDELDGTDALVAALAEILPDSASTAFGTTFSFEAAFSAGGVSPDEARAFDALRPMVMRHVAAAGAADLVPVLGAVGVPAAQASMLAALARARGLDWTPARAAMFASALGGGALLRMGAGFALRQGAKLVPVVGQTLGAAAAGAASGAATWALGRAAHAWLWGQAQGQAPDASDLRALYAGALREGMRQAREGGGNRDPAATTGGSGAGTARQGGSDARR